MSNAQSRPRALVLASGDPASDPRIGWVASSLSQRFNVTELGTHRDRAMHRRPDWTELGEHHWRARLPITSWPAHVSDLGRSTYGGSVGWFALAGFAYDIVGLHAEIAAKKTRIPLAKRQRLNQMKEILATNASLIRAGRALGSADLIVASDLDALVAGVVLKNDLGARLVYDAHEFWPFSFPIFRNTAEEQEWVRIERLLVQETDARIAVSTGLAEEMGRTYGEPFEVIPNAVPLSASPTAPVRRARADGKVEFLFLGGFAPDRGILQLIEAWPQTPDNCLLTLQGPHSNYRQEMIAAAKATGLIDKRITFPEPVSESELIVRAAQADVGLIPYEPTLINHVHCSPNKLSQYMAAGIPILANATRFVSDTISKNECGVVVDFVQPGALAAEVTRLANDAELRKTLGDNARCGFERAFNWEAYEPVLLAAAGGEPTHKAASAGTNPQALLIAEFGPQTHAGPAGRQSPLSTLARSAMRFGLKAAWHGIPFLRVAVLSHPKFRRRAEKFLEI